MGAHRLRGRALVAAARARRGEALDLLCSQAVNSYEVLAPGYHSPLTKTQIAELFQSGRLRRDHRCKQVAQKEWRTIDELFPLLKYQSAGPAFYCSPEPPVLSRETRILILGLLAGACVATALWYYFAHDATARTDPPRVTVHYWPKTISTTPTLAPTVSQQEPPAKLSTDAPSTTYTSRTAIDLQVAQQAEQRRQAEERQREQAASQAERDRLMAERARLEQKAAGRDTIIALDQQGIVNVGGNSVSVMIHDNDVTSFDVWINGSRRRGVRKQKGITESGTDETLIHASDRARLYYVWEISGKLNHCRLRVRED
jgi:hypothetical protein